MLRQRKQQLKQQVLNGRVSLVALLEDVRDLAVDSGHGAGMLPNAAGTVLRRRFGDCKDKSVLLTALLLRDGPQAFASARIEALQQRMPALESNVEDTRFEDDEDGNNLVMTASYGLPTWGRVDAPLSTGFNCGAYGLLLGLDIVDERETRRQPWSLRYP